MGITKIQNPKKQYKKNKSKFKDMLQKVSEKFESTSDLPGRRQKEFMEVLVDGELNNKNARKVKL